MTEYLGLDLEDLYELQTERAREVDSLAARQEWLTERMTAAELELRWEEAEELGEQIDALTDELAPLLDLLDEIEEEIGWRSERECRGYSPMVL